MAASSWNPLRCSGTAPAPNVLLAAKLIALCLLVTHRQAALDFAPAPFGAILKGMFFGTAFALLFNRTAGVSALLLGVATLLPPLVSREYFDIGVLSCGLFLVAASFERGRSEPRALRRLAPLAYAGVAAGVWLTVSQQGSFEHAVQIGAPALELALALAFLFRWAWPYAIWGGVFFHTAAMWAGGGSLATFHFAMLASYLVFATWPQDQLTVLYDGDCGFCETTRRFFEHLDFDRIYDWQPFQGGAGDRWGIRRKALEGAAHAVAGGKVYAGFRAFQAITLYNPVTYFVLALLILAPGGGPSTFRDAVAILAIALYFPAFRPVGEGVYRLVARNRHRLPGEKSCKVA